MFQDADTLDGILERRRHTRLEGLFHVRYLPLSGPMAKHMLTAATEMGLKPETLEGPDEPGVRGVTANVSEGGFCLLTEFKMPEGTHLLVDVNLPGAKSPIRAMTEVMRCTPALSNPALSRHGLRFVAIHPEALTKIKELIDQGNVSKVA